MTKYHVTHEKTFTISARELSKEEEKERRKIDQSWVDGRKKRDKAHLDRAEGRKIVRDFSWVGPCIKLGVLIRETPKFYVFADNAHARDGDIAEFPQKRKLKSGVHVEPCKNCTDHQQTHHPMGRLD